MISEPWYYAPSAAKTGPLLFKLGQEKLKEEDGLDYRPLARGLGRVDGIPDMRI